MFEKGKKELLVQYKKYVMNRKRATQSLSAISRYNILAQTRHETSGIR